MTNDGDDDRALLTRHAAGDREAFATLVERHRDRMWRIALRTLGDHDDAADAVQDAFLSAYRSAGSFRGDAAVTTWLHRIVVNACLDLVRRRASRPASALIDDAAGELVTPGTSPYDASDTSAAVLSALRRLPIEQAAAVVIVDVEGFSVHEAAQILDAPEGTVKSRCARGRARLAELLSDLGPGNRAASPPVQRSVTQPPSDEHGISEPDIERDT
jgi:RNA polymerase sigma-70 factor, ECF subfamily